ncbi:Plant invertase/pectin methylesterase inhibitor superfamily [Euphorbia peplus]|nr:Plant invertase/pectin methylesterase inhibitor superfamily [Euphorbia peplus]
MAKSSPKIHDLIIIILIISSFLILQNSLAYSQSEEIKSSCKATRNPDGCFSILSQSNLIPPFPTPLQIIKSTLLISSNNLATAKSMVQSLLASSDNLDLTGVAGFCLEMLDYSRRRINQLNNTLPAGKIKNVRAWMSAAVAYQSDCSGGLSFQGGKTKPVNDTVAFINSVVNISSYALSMIVSYDIYGNETQFWRPPLTERDGVWEWPSSFGGEMRRWRFPVGLTANVTVCKDGKDGCYRTVQEAVNAAPNNTKEGRFVIYVKEGVYEEIVRVPMEKKRVVMLGDGMGKSVITGSLTVAQLGMNTFDSATFGVVGDGFMASGLTFQNTAGIPTRQAVAFRSDSDFSFIENCEFIGNQDTLYVHSLRQYYKSCRIEGNVDFIFGNAAAVFHDCKMIVSPRQENPENGETNVVTAQGRTDPAMSTGFVFENCSINGTEEYMRLYNSNPSVHQNYLGRPWKEFSRVVYINSKFEALLSPEGWMPWNGDFALATLYYGEFHNSGPGSDLSMRVNWSNLIPPQHLSTYSLQNFVQGDDWIPHK